MNEQEFITLDDYVRRFLSHCENESVELDEELLYKLVEIRYGKPWVPHARGIVLAHQENS